MLTFVLPEHSQVRPEFSATRSRSGGDQRLHFSGELDIAAREFVYHECIAEGVVVTVEMDRLTFMDCCGYGGLMAARRELEQRGGSLTMRGFVGQPARLVALISACGVPTRRANP